jgi:DNA (cytosine-5)-methyltransferase 1
MSLTYGELFAGYGGLGLGVQSVLGGEMSWCAEFDAAPSKILAHHWPDVPNLGDVTKVDWASVPRVDVITGGSPCQDLSHAGKRAGMKAGTRSGLWASMCDAIDIIRPRLVVWENVRGALSAEADSGVEPCPICVGDEPGATLRALGRVLGDLAELGYDARWYGLRAADVGAPHGRFRIFVFAHPTGDQRWISNGDNSLAGLTDDLGGEWAGSPRPGWAGSADAGLTPDPDTDQSAEGDDYLDAMLAAAHSDTAFERRRTARGYDRVRTAGLVESVAADADRGRLEVSQELDSHTTQTPADGDSCREHTDGHPCTAPADASDAADIATRPLSRRVPGVTDWGQYAPAIARWGAVLGRPAPAPTEAGPKGGQRLSPRFVEWLMGLPAGHVTDVSISRNDQLKALGNGVVPQQAAEATRRFLAHIVSEKAA